MNIIRAISTFIFILYIGTCFGEQPEKNEADGKEYRIDQPGTITFTVGIKIKGKVEKPQVLIFIPKEKPQYRETSYNYSFKENIEEPLPFSPIIE